MKKLLIVLFFTISVFISKADNTTIDSLINLTDDEKDGMHIYLCSFDLENNKLEYAGAINSMFHIKGKELVEIKGDKQPIGQFSNIKPFTTHKINLIKGDKIYLFSDGYAD